MYWVSDVELYIGLRLYRGYGGNNMSISRIILKENEISLFVRTVKLN